MGRADNFAATCRTDNARSQLDNLSEARFFLRPRNSSLLRLLWIVFCEKFGKSSCATLE